MARADRIGPLSRAIVKAFYRAGFGPADLLGEDSPHVNLPWQVPPLQTPLSLNSMLLQTVWDRKQKVDTGALFEFWSTGLHALYHNPREMGHEYGWQRASRVLNNSTIGDRNLRFSLPEEWPKPVAWAGALFSVEAAYLLHTCSDMPVIREDATDTFYVDTEHGPIGLSGGVPACESSWDDPMYGMLESFLGSPRGFITTTQRYDLLAKLRSLLHTHAQRFAEFDAVDMAIQTLRYLEGPAKNDHLNTAIIEMVPVVRNTQRSIGIVDDCRNIMAEWESSDRTKVLQVHGRLVPEVVSEHRFAKEIWNLQNNPPISMRASSLERINSNLKTLRRSLIELLPAEEQANYLGEET